MYHVPLEIFRNRMLVKNAAKYKSSQSLEKFDPYLALFLKLAPNALCLKIY